MNTNNLDIGDVVAIFIIGTLYLLPPFIAYSKHKKAVVPIFIYNLLLGWTGLGWIASLLWALFSERRETSNQ